MNPREALTAWFAQLAPRERVMVLVCGAVVVVFSIWSFVIQPLFVNAAELTERVEQKQLQLANLQELAARHKALSGSADGTVITNHECCFSC
jgi:type II secretory pathway component PulM